MDVFTLDYTWFLLLSFHPFQVNAALPFNSRGHGAPSLSLLQVLSVSIHPKTEALWEKEIPLLLSILEGMER